MTHEHGSSTWTGGGGNRHRTASIIDDGMPSSALPQSILPVNPVLPMPHLLRCHMSR